MGWRPSRPGAPGKNPPRTCSTAWTQPERPFDGCWAGHSPRGAPWPCLCPPLRTPRHSPAPLSS
jgi:hypothetical protein